MTASIQCRKMGEPVWKLSLPGRYPWEDRVHIWRIRVDMDANILPGSPIESFLDPGEHAKAARFLNALDMRRYMLGHGILKYLATHHFGVSPGETTLDLGPHSKPFFRDLLSYPLANSCRLEFNISHGGDWILLAFAGSSVGIDIAQTDEIDSFDGLLERTFSATEMQSIQKSPQSASAFTRYWTRKEALLKATGKGLVDELPEVPCLDGCHETPCAIIGSRDSWIVSSFPVSNGHIASIAHRDHINNLHFWECLDSIYW